VKSEYGDLEEERGITPLTLADRRQQQRQRQSQRSQALTAERRQRA
jgi:hypothetical protein